MAPHSPATGLVVPSSAANRHRPWCGDRGQGPACRAAAPGSRRRASPARCHPARPPRPSRPAACCRGRLPVTRPAAPRPAQRHWPAARRPSNPDAPAQDVPERVHAAAQLTRRTEKPPGLAQHVEPLAARGPRPRAPHYSPAAPHRRGIAHPCPRGSSAHRRPRQCPPLPPDPASTERTTPRPRPGPRVPMARHAGQRAQGAERRGQPPAPAARAPPARPPVAPRPRVNSAPNRLSPSPKGLASDSSWHTAR